MVESPNTRQKGMNGNHLMLRRLFAMVNGLFGVSGRSKPYEEPLPSNQPGSFSFTEVESKETPEGTLKTWRAISRGTDTHPFNFRLEMLLKPPKGDLPMAFSKGAIIRESGADGRRFLGEVERAIESDAEVPTKSERSGRL